MIGNILFALVFFGGAFLMGGWPYMLIAGLMLGALYFIENPSH